MAAVDLLPRIAGLEALRALTTGHPAVRVAVLDGPVDADAVGGRLTPAGGADHGTLVCSIIAGSKDGLTPGLAPDCTTIPIPVFSGAPSAGCSQQDMAQAIDRALGHGAQIINISAAQQADALAMSLELSGAIQRALAADALLVASAGNHGCACDTIPASTPGVLAVGAHGGDGAPLLSSNWGPGQRSQGLLAPGLEVAGACVGGGVCRGTGTSFAAAVTSGAAALLMSVAAGLGFAPSGGLVRRVLLQSSDRTAPADAEALSRYLAGRLDLSRSVELLLSELMTSGRKGATVETAAEPVHLQSAVEAANASDPGVATLAQAPAPAGAEAGLSLADCGCGGDGKAKPGGAQGCGCGDKAKAPQLVYAIGRLGVSFLSLARRDAIWRNIHGREAGATRSLTPEIDLRPIDNASLRELLLKEPWQAQSVVWTLSRTEVPMYAIMPTGPFGEHTLKWMVEQWSDPQVEFISLPGVIAGQATLYDGSTVDVVVPDLRGMYSWNSAAYADALVKSAPRSAKDKKAADDGSELEFVGRFLSKIYYRLRNRGLSPEERALNAAATNAFNVSDVIIAAGADGLAFRDVSVEKSPFNRPGSQYYDVLMSFFAPRDRLGQASLVARFTIDVSDTVPVVVGEPVQWYEY